MDSALFLTRPPTETQPLYVLHGDEAFLKRQVLATLRHRILGDEPDSPGLTVLTGDTASLAAVRDELDTLPFLSPRRLVIIEDGDGFVTKYRAQLEKVLAAPAWRGVLALEVRTWAANTKLAKMIDQARTVVCKSLTESQLPDWCVRWAASRHDKKLTPGAAKLLVELVGVEMGMIDQELAKLAVYVGAADKIAESDVDHLVGRSREANVFKMFAAVGAGQPADALGILDQLFEQAEEPLRILGAVSYQVRKLVQAARLSQQGKPLGLAMSEAGVPPFAQRECELQLKHLGRRRIDRLYDWLLDADAGLKGSSPLPPRLILERLLVKMARPSGPVQAR